MRTLVGVLGLSLCSAALGQFQLVFPTLPHAASNAFPFNQTPGTTMHQVYASTLFSGPSGGAPVSISRIAFAPTTEETYSGNIVLRLGYTSALPGQTPAAGGLQIPDIGGGGAPNATGPMVDFFNQTEFEFTAVAPDPQNFQFTLDGNFVYDPSQGNLLMEIYLTNIVTGFNISRCAGSAEASRAYNRHSGATGALNTQAHRTEFVFDIAQTSCYPDCNGDDVLNLSDFGCFTTKFALGDPYADCNGDTLLNLSDFGCFTTKFALGCP